MFRDLLAKLTVWKTHPLRMPLILRGARQVGKSWLVKEFGKSFEHFVEINFEKNPEAKVFFERNLNIETLLEKLSMYSGKKIVSGKTLLFFDEVQESEGCLTALRYFKEEHPDLHVIAAGSLIDFILEKIGMPVGRVQFLYLYPMSFGEFLSASNRSDLRTYILSGQADPTIHSLINQQLKQYMWLGGMPAVVETWLEYQDPSLCQEIQDRIIYTYQQDFHKYAKHNKIEHVTKVFESIPIQLGRKFKFNHIDQDLRGVPLKEALWLLIKAGIAYPCFHTSGHQWPMGAAKDDKKFKIFFFDVGLAQRMLGLDLSDWVTQPFDLKYLGSMAEQLVAQEFIAYSNSAKQAELYYWHRESSQSNAEVDFLFVKKGLIIPVEVKSSTQGGMKSLKVYKEIHPKCVLALKISEGLHPNQTFIEEIPLYGLEAWLKKKSD